MTEITKEQLDNAFDLIATLRENVGELEFRTAQRDMANKRVDELKNVIANMKNADDVKLAQLHARLNNQADTIIFFRNERDRLKEENKNIRFQIASCETDKRYLIGCRETAEVLLDKTVEALRQLKTRFQLKCTSYRELRTLFNEYRTEALALRERVKYLELLYQRNEDE